MGNRKEIEILRELVKNYLDVCRDKRQDELRILWSRHNSMKKVKPLIYVRAFAWREMPDSKCKIEDPFFAGYENILRESLFRSSFKDDFIFEPWLTVAATYRTEGWGIEGSKICTEEDNTLTAWKEDYPIKDLQDIEKMKLPAHEIDEVKTAEEHERLFDAVGDMITINVDRGSAYRMWTADISTTLGHLRGIENLMLDMMDNPEWLHRLLSFMRDGILKAQKEAESAGDWGLCAHQNQAMPYADELQRPAPNRNGVKRRDLWCHMSSQEYTLVSPAMQDEFLLQYQLPILKEFGLASYGCCEDLSAKIDILRQIPNLRRIAVSPFANVAKCAEQIGKDYVLSYRPSPADMVSYGFDEDRISKILRRDLNICRNSHVDVTLKDVETVQHDTSRIRKWTELTRNIIDEVFI